LWGEKKILKDLCKDLSGRGRLRGGGAHKKEEVKRFVRPVQFPGKHKRN